MKHWDRRGRHPYPSANVQPNNGSWTGKTNRPAHFYNHTQEYQSPQRIVPNNSLQLDASGAPFIPHSIPGGEPAEQEPAPPWAMTNGSLDLAQSGEWGGKCLGQSNPSTLPVLHLETGHQGMICSRWIASQIDKQRILTLEGTSEAQRSGWLLLSHTACKWQMQDRNLSPLTLTLSSFARSCWEKHKDIRNKVHLQLPAPLSAPTSSAPCHSGLRGFSVPTPKLYLAFRLL